MNIWRFNLHTHNGIEEQIKVFEYCKENGIIGTGWKTKDRLMDSKKEKISNEEFINRLNMHKNDFDKPEGFKRAMKCLREMEIDDLIWTRKNNKYYLCRVTGKANDFLEGERNKEIEEGFIDIWHYIPCEFIEVGTEENVIGAVIKSFNMGVVCHIRGNGAEEIVREFSMKTYNKYVGKDYYEVSNLYNQKANLWSILSVMEIEELVGLYMQIKLRYGIYTSTNKKDTKEYEFILFKLNNPREKAKLQVKTSNINLDLYNYDDCIFYFFTTGDYFKNGKKLGQNELNTFEKNNNVKFIDKKDLINFVKNNEEFLPYKLNWF